MKSVQLEAIASVSHISWGRTEAYIPIVTTNSLRAFTRLGDSKYSPVKIKTGCERPFHEGKSTPEQDRP
ncbi:hypothetical protein H6F50_10560 [Coleofasciculus sp. FACHB-712]|uniref:hypothetical protein n=1 Tax=Cyanophyceae TaxID=3028117 RepID=UPI0016892AC4|nr:MULTISPECIES: hypothetical protein [unclassified Coleofasciculus]MBD1942794.1 hypothetical protein [Coleofasciculus sp. FACHB-712]MBD2087722.1 hypothetical protein [Coleofasciculus sp. FACHB-542]MBD2541337.1 hypothetical protein [Coleofasciculus sp. FACHB-SPT36]